MTEAAGAYRTRVLIVSDVRLYRDGVVAGLASHERVFVAGSAGSRAKARAIAAELRPDVVLIDIAMAEGTDLIRDLRVTVPAALVLALAVNELTADVLACAQAGAAGYVTLDASIDDLVAAIDRTIAGELLCSTRVAAELFREIGVRRVAECHTPDAPPPEPLTSRERQVLDQLRLGLSNKEIASALHIAEATVKNHVHHILEKLQVMRRSQVVAYPTPGPPARAHRLVPIQKRIQVSAESLDESNLNRS